MADGKGRGICVKLGIIPSSLFISNRGADITNKFNGSVDIISGTQNTVFAIYEKNIPPSVITKVLGQMPLNDIISIAINGVCVYDTMRPGSDSVGNDCGSGVITYSTKKIAEVANAPETPGKQSYFGIAYGM